MESSSAALPSATPAWKGKRECRFLVQSLDTIDFVDEKGAERCDGLGTGIIILVVFAHGYSIGGGPSGSYCCPGVPAYCVRMYSACVEHVMGIIWNEKQPLSSLARLLVH